MRKHRINVSMAVLGGGLAIAGARWAWRRWRQRAGSLRGKVVLVTGSSRGLGHLLARLAAAEGAKVTICARDAVELERARLNLDERGAEVLALACDVTQPAQVERLVTETIARFGRIDVLVNNAGVIQVGPLDEMTLQDFQRAMDVNFWGAVHATLAVLPYMRQRRQGRIVNITSIGGKVAMPHLLPYDCAKFAALGFSEGLRAEVAKDDISVTTVIPGLMRTGSVVSAEFKGRAEEEFRWFAAAARSRLISLDVRSAARRVLAAMRAGDGEVVLGWPAKLLCVGKELFPHLFAHVMVRVNRSLPARGSAAPSLGKEIVNAQRLRAFGAPAGSLGRGRDPW